jgi:RND family efflux transporter MFP subunit
MSRGKWVLGVAVLALIGGAVLWRGIGPTDGAKARTARAANNRPVAVVVAKAERKQVPVQIDALGTVTPIASVALKARVDTNITDVHFQDGALVHKGDMLFTLDDRAIRAQIAQTEGQIARDKAQLEGAVRDVRRYTDLVAKGATPIVNLDNAKTQADVFKAAIQADTGTLENLKVQLSYTIVTAPITGRISAANVKVGNFVRQADTTPMATINQMAPVYLSFTIPQKNLPEIRQAITAKTASIQALIPGTQKRAQGEVSMIENTVDSTTGMAMVRATMPNKDELLWPGTLVTAEMTLRKEDAVTVPTNAIEVSQSGSVVFVIDNGVAKLRHITTERQVGEETVVASGLKDGETVVVDGQILLRDGVKVEARSRKAPPKAAAGS